MISNKCYYALRATLELAKRQGSGPITIGQLAKAQQIPVRFLEAILRQLKQAGITDSIRGKEGGYFLARRANEINVYDVLKIIEGSLVEVNPTAGGKRTQDVFDQVWKDAETSLSESMQTTTFEILAKSEKDFEKQAVPDYSI